MCTLFEWLPGIPGCVCSSRFALVLVISLCRLTVGVGTINGLIFYANIVAVNKFLQDNLLLG